MILRRTVYVYQETSQESDFVEVDMIKKIFLFFNGKYKVTVAKKDLTKAANLMYNFGLSCVSSRINSSQDMEFVITRESRKKLIEVFTAEGLSFSVSEIIGFPVFLKFLAGRPGFILGFLLFAVLTFYSSKIVWNINVYGNDSLSDEAVISILDEFGCGVGDYIPNINFDKLHGNILAEREDISWISVNMRGTVANVEIREARHGESFAAPDGTFANIVAKEDAQIYSTEVTSGKSAVKKGNVVKKGELLISGIVPVRPDKVRYEYATGTVLGYVSRKVSVEIPFETNQKVYTGRSSTENRIKIFKKYINLSLKGGIEYTVYDKIESREQITLLGIIKLPIWFESTKYLEYTHEQTNQSKSESVSAGFAELRERLDEILLDCELVSAKYTKDVTDSAFIIKADLVCLTDIGHTIEFTTEGSPDAQR